MKHVKIEKIKKLKNPQLWDAFERLVAARSSFFAKSLKGLVKACPVRGVVTGFFQ